VAWGLIIAIAVIGVLAVVYVVSGRGGSGAAASSGAPSPTPVVADTQGAYATLVQRANSLYDQGAAKLDAKQYAQGAAYFEAAATVYAAAWKKQSTDPGVGTDFATSLFYSGKVDAALAQVNKVLAQSPSYQTAWFNKGNFLTQKATDASNAGDDSGAKKAYAQAKAAYQKAIDLGPSTSSGQQAKEQLSQLPK
jgi:tetratricopeptide (TPR) repeat protein